MPRRNSHRKKLAAHASYVSAERALAERTAVRLERKVLRAATDDLALALSSSVALGPAAPAAAGDEDMAARRSRVRKRNATRKKDAERLRKIVGRRDERRARSGDVEMGDGDGEREEMGAVRLRGREGRGASGVRKVRTVSASKGRRVERKARAKRLMRETLVADVAAGEVVKGDD